MKAPIKVATILCIILSTIHLGFSQANTCASATVLCSLDDLDGFTGTMPQFNNTGEFPPGGLCPGGGTNQNITWFAFIASSATATLDLITTNCQGGGASPAIQYGIYTDCNFTDAVLCVSGAVPVGTTTINITGLVPGDDYFFFIDGDLGTFCDYEIDVISGGGQVPLPQPTGIDCISSDCPPVGASACLIPLTLTFEVVGIGLSIDYIWTVTPSPPVGNTVVGSNENTFTFDNAGTYQICVIADNGCTTTAPVCYDLVIDPPEAGTLMAGPLVLCPDDFSLAVASGFNMSTSLSHAIIAVDADGIVVDVAMGGMLNFTYDRCGTVTVYSYNYNPADSPLPPNIGSFFAVPSCLTTCCEIESLQVIFEDVDSPTFVSTPDNIDIQCEGDLPPLAELVWQDNCSGTGTVEAEEVFNTTLCEGGSVVRTWTYTDGCGNFVEHNQFITISDGIAAPTASDVTIQLCLSTSTSDTIVLSSLDDQVNSDGTFDISYHPTLVDATDGTNQLADQYIVTGADTLYVTVANACDCSAIGQIFIVAAPAPTYDMAIEHVSCLDSMDAVITISNLLPTGTMIAFDNLDYGDSLRYDSLAAGNYVINTIAPDGCTGSDTLIVNQGQNITLSNLSIVCNTNDTPSDNSDDRYEVVLTVTDSTATMDSIDIASDSGPIGRFPYGTIAFTLPTGPSQVIVLTDDQTGCSVSFDTGDLSPCSDDCIVLTDSLTIICDDGGTAGQPGDDLYTFTFAVSVINSSSTQYVFLLDSIEIDRYTYGALISYTVPADGMSHELLFMDVSDSTCVLLVLSPELTPCSGECGLRAVAQPPICDNLGTTLDSLDDVYTAEIAITIDTGSGQWIILPTGDTGASGDMVTVGPFPVSGGDQTLIIQDVNIPTCADTIVLVAPSPCSECIGAVEAGDDWVLTCSLSAADLVGVAQPATVGSWSGPDGFVFDGNEVQVDLPGTYYFTADYGQDCILTDSLVVTLSNDIPQLTEQAPLTITCLVDSALLATTVLGGSGNLEYRWLDAGMNLLSNEEELVVFTGGTYFLVVYDIDTDCTTPATAFVVNEETADLDPQINADPGFVIDCVVDAVTLRVTEEADVNYDWYVGNVLISGVGTQLTVSEAATIRLEATNTVTGCMGEATLVIEDQIGYPIVFVEAADTLDCLNTAVTLDGSSSQMGSTITYTWLDVDSMVIGTAISTLTVDASGTYYLQLIDLDNNCITWDTVEVFSNVVLPDIQLAESVTIPCDQDEVTIVLDVTDASYAINWTTEAGTITSATDGSEITVSSAGIYVAEVINPDNQCAAIDTIVVTTYDQVTAINLATDNQSCEESANGRVTILNVDGGAPPYTYQLDGLDVADDIIDNLAAGTYTIVVTDTNGCTFDRSIVIGVDEPFAIVIPAEITVLQNESALLTAAINIDPQEIASIVWSPSERLSCPTCLTTSVTAGAQDIVYTIGVTDIYGCYAEAMVTIIAAQVLTITTPNVINPSSLTGNSRFTIYTSVPATIDKLSIYDRWGNVVYQVGGIPSNDASLGWDGRFSGRSAAQGVYVYTYTLTTVDQEVVTRTGDVTILGGD